MNMLGAELQPKLPGAAACLLRHNSSDCTLGAPSSPSSVQHTLRYDVISVSACGHKAASLRCCFSIAVRSSDGRRGGGGSRI